MKIVCSRQTITEQTDRRTNISLSRAPVGAKNIPSNYFCIKGEALDEKRLMTKTAGIIKKKLGTKSLKELIKDEEFRNSIFHRFAVLKLPLRKGKSSND